MEGDMNQLISCNIFDTDETISWEYTFIFIYLAIKLDESEEANTRVKS